MGLPEDRGRVRLGEGVGGLTFITGSTFAAASSVSVDSCFSATYENYLVLVSNLSTSANAVITLRLRVAGVDTVGTDYGFGINVTDSAGTNAPIGASGVGGIRAATAGGSAINDGLLEILLMRPAVASRTLVIVNTARRLATATGSREAGFGAHNAATAFDGFSLVPASGTFTGTYRVYGYQDS